MNANLFTQLFLFLGAGACLAAFAGSRRWHFALLAAALLYLGIDESWSFHERAGLWMEDRGFPTVLVRDADTFILLGYGALLLALVAVRWRELTRPRINRYAFAAAIFFAGVSLLMDARLSHTAWHAHDEEYFEAAATGCLAFAFLVHAWRSAPGRAHWGGGTNMPTASPAVLAVSGALEAPVHAPAGDP